MYKIVACISMIIRSFCIDNPFKQFFKKDYLYLNSNTAADLFNILIGETIISVSSYILAGSIYKKRQMDPSIGSICYLLSYILNTIIMKNLCTILSTSDLKIVIIIYFIVNIILYFIVYSVKYVLNNLNSRIYI